MEDCVELWFISPYRVEIRPAQIPVPGIDQMLVRSRLSAISAGTELLFLRGEFPHDLAVDDSIPSLKTEPRYPLRYGYSLVGEVVAVGSGVDKAWLGRQVFSFQPHGSYFLAAPGEVIPLPSGIEPETGVFLPNMETAVNFLMDGAPMIGEAVLVFGQGIVGLLTSALLLRFPLGMLLALDRYPLRRQAAQALGVPVSFDPQDPQTIARIKALIPDGADLAFEISGAPTALDTAISLARFEGRIVVGSWYGEKKSNLNLGGAFHRNRLHLISSQVSTIASELTGRWTKARRFQLAWDLLQKIRPERWITHKFPITQASEAYCLLNEKPGEAIQVVFTYD